MNNDIMWGRIYDYVAKYYVASYRLDIASYIYEFTKAVFRKGLKNNPQQAAIPQF